MRCITFSTDFRPWVDQNWLETVWDRALEAGNGGVRLWIFASTHSFTTAWDMTSHWVERWAGRRRSSGKGGRIAISLVILGLSTNIFLLRFLLLLHSFQNQAVPSAPRERPVPRSHGREPGFQLPEIFPPCFSLPLLSSHPHQNVHSTARLPVHTKTTHYPSKGAAHLSVRPIPLTRYAISASITDPLLSQDTANHTAVNLVVLVVAQGKRFLGILRSTPVGWFPRTVNADSARPLCPLSDLYQHYQLLSPYRS
jgi:hypothetical protein